MLKETPQTVFNNALVQLQRQCAYTHREGHNPARYISYCCKI